MNVNEVAALLNYAGTVDTRVARELVDPTTTARTIATWAEALADIPAQAPVVHWDVATAVRGYYESTDAKYWAIQPRALLAAWAPYRAELMGRHTDPEPELDSGPDEYTAIGYRENLLARRRAVVTGAALPVEYHAPAIDAGGTRRLGEMIKASVRAQYEAARDQVAQVSNAPSRSRFPELSVACPYDKCRAAPLRPCRTPDGVRLNHNTHPSRRDAYAAAEQERATA
ncbi:zinc finger domain-containing protein [Embleya sp. MST-111070]|uniref:zinc finger domain-containing protein n=1 Tax=Embleya sp. MST-111070 TaxID=3398231 RepID=UPI003F7335B5